MRTHIAKSLQKRCKAIQNAVKAYNAAAVALDPPRPTLDWTRVSHYGFLDEFNLLRDTRQDIRDKPWTDLAVRETMKQDVRIKRAHEEIDRCNIELRRLHTSIVNEHHSFDLVLPQLKESGNPLYGAVEDYVTRRHRVNNLILSRIFQTYSLKNFTGDPLPGVRKGSVPMASVISQSSLMADMHELERDDDESDDESDVARDIGGLVDYVSEMS